jgi:PIN domain nuclease of toxin-antitoxin system
VLRAITDSPRLSARAWEFILAPSCHLRVSVASAWEVTIKHSLGRGDMPVSGNDFRLYCQEAGYRFLAIEAEHVLAVGPLPPLHQDPFDRLLVAQAMVEPLRLMTHDQQVARYSDSILLV